MSQTDSRTRRQADNLSRPQMRILALVEAANQDGRRYISRDGNEDRTLRSLRRRGLVEFIRDSGPAGWRLA
jgi:hypothetical protein